MPIVLEKRNNDENNKSNKRATSSNVEYDILKHPLTDYITSIHFENAFIKSIGLEKYLSLMQDRLTYTVKNAYQDDKNVIEKLDNLVNGMINKNKEDKKDKNVFKVYMILYIFSDEIKLIKYFDEILKVKDGDLFILFLMTTVFRKFCLCVGRYRIFHKITLDKNLIQYIRILYGSIESDTLKKIVKETFLDNVYVLKKDIRDKERILKEYFICKRRFNEMIKKVDILEHA